MRTLRRRLAGRQPVFVWSMAKTASTSLEHAVEAGLGRPALHCHRITPAGRAAIRRAEERDRSVERDRWTGEFVHRLSMSPAPSGRWEVVCGVRDPMSRSVSQFFQVAAPMGYLAGDGAGVATRDLWDRYVDFHGSYIGDRDWFVDELQAATGIDVYAQPFDWSRGWQSYTNDRWKVLVIRFEDLPRVASAALEAFFDTGEPIAVPRQNAAADKAVGDAYRRFRAEAVVPEDTLAGAYGTRQARHFYSPQELEAFRSRWRR